MANTYKNVRRVTTRSAAKAMPKVVISKVPSPKSKGDTPKSKTAKANVATSESKTVKSKAVKAKAKVAASDVASKIPLLKEDYEHIHYWLESKENFAAVCGISGKTPIGKGMKSPRQGWTELAEIVSRKCKGRISIEPRVMKERFKRYKSKHYKTKTMSLGTGFGITKEDRLKGIYSIADKLDNVCPFFSKMDKLFGGKPNVVPLGEICMNNTTYFRGIDGFDDTSDEDSDSDNATSDNDSGGTHINKNHAFQAFVNGDHNQNELDRQDQGDSDFDGCWDHTQLDQVENNNNGNLGTEEVEEESELYEVDKAEQTSAEKENFQQKRGRSDELAVSSKRSRVKDTRKAPFKLTTGPVQQTRNGFASAYAESAAAKLILLKEQNDQKLALEKQARLIQIEVENRKVELEEKKLATKKELLSMRLKSEAEADSRRNRSLVVQSALAKGFDANAIRDLLDLVDQSLW
ncbi:hypothetical protein BGZ59_011731 [Podila verticillata]|uniref:Myb/SANT-like domain-containing protein n=1 Tax=Podila verticillata NRRL 6337 TaxID=1069443 RepID=A0A086TLT3_9FUNG|nr:hypothetical protein BGZ59_011731 [Podila verticillata]KFH62910.1 hypothetical protein MVEG_11434 [Podila verticillata NRRL 6337]